MNTKTEFIDGPNGYKLAYNYTKGSKDTGVIFLPGLKSDKRGSKAEFVQQLADEHDFSYLRLDYGGHGESGGKFTDGSMGDWYEDTKFVIEQVTTGPQIVIGSSMGGWVGLLLAHRDALDLKAFIGIAPAPDFHLSILGRINEAQKNALISHGYFEEESGYDEPYIFTKHLLDEAQNHGLLDGRINYEGPVRILQGKRDESVDWKTPEKIKQSLISDDINIHLVEDGDHSLSRPQDLELLKAQILDFL